VTGEVDERMGAGTNRAADGDPRSARLMIDTASTFITVSAIEDTDLQVLNACADGQVGVNPSYAPGMASILIVEDDAAIATPLVRAIEREGFAVVHVTSGTDALTARNDVDLVLLDLTLPDVDGLDVCRSIRDRDARLPIVILTARAEESDVVTGLDAGADDYVTKPFRLAELLARLRVRLRLATPRSAIVQDVCVDPQAHRAWQDGRELELTPKEFDLLALLVTDAGRVVSRQRIMHDVWDEHYYGSTRTLDMHISSLRKKLGDDPTHPRLITTVRGVGFRFEIG
jgi:DNA-binding response OmpR family regulator